MADDLIFLNNSTGRVAEMTKIRIRAGEVEVEYEGDEKITKADLFEIIEKLSKLKPVAAVRPAGNKPQSGHPTSSSANDTPGHSTDTIANILKTKTGPDLAISAAAHMHFTLNKSVFTRQELVKEMKSAPNHYKDSYARNMKAYLKTLTGNNVKIDQKENILFSV